MALLDTNLVIDWTREAKRRKPGPALAKLAELESRGEPRRLAIFTIAELYVGVRKAAQPDAEQLAIELAIQACETVSFGGPAARIFGRIVGELELAGLKISDMDALIASVALEHDELLITRNVRHFARIPGIRVESY